MEQFSLGAFFEALFKYGKEYGLTLWHFMGLAMLGVVVWVASKVAQGAGKAVTGAQNVYIKMIEDLQKKNDADRERQEARLAELDAKIARDKSYIAQLEADLEAERTKKLEYARRLTELQTKPAQPPLHDGVPDARPDPA